MKANYINRSMEKKIKDMEGKFPAILVTGSRQCGKSTLLKYITTKGDRKINSVTLDDMKERTIAQEDPELFIRTHDTPLIIDEFQYAPKLLSYIKIKIDEARENELLGDGTEVGTLYYLTGSQVFETMEEVSESLAGRIGILDLHPLSTRELNKSTEEVFVPDIQKIKSKEPVKKETLSKLFDRIYKGSYPELYKQKENDIEAYFSSYIRTYIERDIRKIIHIQNEAKFVRFISAMAARTAQEFNAADIAKDIEVDETTVKNWTSVLVNTYLIFLLQPHMNNNVGRIIKRPKIYFMDTGLACYLTGYMNSETLQKSAYSGQIFETYVISEIVKSYTNNQKDPKKYLYYYRDNNQKEIDLLVINENNIYPVEIKKSANPSKDAIKNFSIVDKFEMNSPNGIVLCLTEKIHPIDGKNFLVPIEYI